MWNIVRNKFERRPFWMNAIFVFCIYMTFIYLPWDVLIKPVSEDEEVWFGILFNGWLAKVGGVMHWVVYSALTFGFWSMSRWLNLWGALYLLQVALSMVVWGWLNSEGEGAWTSLAVGVLFVIGAFFFYNNRST